MIISRALLAAGLVAVSIGTATAEDAPACASFSWSVARERAAFGAPNLPTLASGSACRRYQGVQLALKPVAEITLPVPSDKK